ncbi:MAG: FMN-binding protein [Bacillota bacterium]
MRGNGLKRGIGIALTGLVGLVSVAVVLSGCRPKIYNDGTYKGISTAGDKGYAIADVVIEKDTIKSVKLTEINELGLEKDYATYPYPKAKEANEEMAKRFIGRSDNQVDTYAGATMSSSQYKEAVGFALEKAKRTPSIETVAFDGTFAGRSKETPEGWQVAWVTIQGDKITSVRLDDVEDGKLKDWVTYSYVKAVEAKGLLEKAMVDKNTTIVDTVAGATRSCTGWIEAASQAWQNAKVR